MPSRFATNIMLAPSGDSSVLGADPVGACSDSSLTNPEPAAANEGLSHVQGEPGPSSSGAEQSISAEPPPSQPPKDNAPGPSSAPPGPLAEKQEEDVAENEEEHWASEDQLKSIRYIMKKAMGENHGGVTTEASRAVSHATSEFLSFIVSEARLKASKEGRRVVGFPDIMATLDMLGFKCVPRPAAASPTPGLPLSAQSSAERLRCLSLSNLTIACPPPLRLAPPQRLRGAPRCSHAQALSP